MSYENAPATIMLATHCAVCARPLVDAKSVELGIGPDCCVKYGFDLDVNEDDRAAANKLVHAIALNRADAFAVVDSCKALRKLGFEKLAARVLERVAKITITESAGFLAVHAPYCEEAIAAWRSVPHQRWDAESKCRVVPATSRQALYELLLAHYCGSVAVGPKGAFIVGSR